MSREATDIRWLPVDDASSPGAVRHHVTALAADLGFSDNRRGEVAIATTELATNLYRHATAGTIAVGVLRRQDQVAIQVVSVDSGPGMANLDEALVDGTSTAGSLGIGLGAVRRLASWFDAHSVLDRGSVIAATFWPGPPPAERAAVGALNRPMTGQTVCGDAWGERDDGGCVTVMLADGLGHGPLAALASGRAARSFGAGGGPLAEIEAIHRALSGTRGAAVAVAEIDRVNRHVRFAGVGNVASWIDGAEGRRAMVSHPGIVGGQIRSAREVALDLPPDALVILHSDGLTDKWNLRRYPGLRRCPPTLVAATLMRDAGVRIDDASVVVADVGSFGAGGRG